MRYVGSVGLSEQGRLFRRGGGSAEWPSVGARRGDPHPTPVSGAGGGVSWGHTHITSEACEGPAGSARLAHPCDCCLVARWLQCICTLTRVFVLVCVCLNYTSDIAAETGYKWLSLSSLGGLAVLLLPWSYMPPQSPLQEHSGAWGICHPSRSIPVSLSLQPVCRL